MARIDMSGLGDYIREQRDQAQMSLRQLAKGAEISNAYLSQVERGLRRPSADILYKIAGALRISAEQLYVRAGILEERAGDADVTAAIAADPTLTDKQRRTLLDIYAAFQAENAVREQQQRDAAPAAATPQPAPAGATSGTTGRTEREDTP